ncbi:MAG: excinuclease ABC subunit UvrC [Clostridia bacterium]|nr:excinuclease ABC subunit UvrC [Clostridia bacterium]
MSLAQNPVREELLKKAGELPLRPGVYIMKDDRGRIIYVGKSKKLRNRVSQYFMNGEKTAKNARMVSLVRDFDYILCDTEIEALALENTLIKKHSPRYNIKLKDAKSYPYIKMTNEEYPRFVFTRTRTEDKGGYFGPYSGSKIASSLLSVIYKNIGIPSCKRSFPRDIGKERPCIYYEMGQCCGLCTGDVSREEYTKLCSLASGLLKGNTASVIEELEKKMFSLAEEERYESAAAVRDSLKVLREIETNQKVLASPDENIDVVGVAKGESLFGVAIFIIRNGALTDKREFVFTADSIVDDSALISFLCDQYSNKELVPKIVLLSFTPEEEELELFKSYLNTLCKRKVDVRVPTRGDKHKLCIMVEDNIKEKVLDTEKKNYSAEELLCELASILGTESIPSRIEAWDISNLSYENITAGMITLENAEFKKSDYRIFKIKNVSGADDYSSMREAVKRRFSHLSDEDPSFAEMPDLVLLDGGKGHVSTVCDALLEMHISVPVFGMVKDDFHRTRALCTENEEISIDNNRKIYNFIYKIQEEVHRFTVSRMMGAKLRTLTSSVLCEIDGIGKTKAKILLEHFGSVNEIAEASIDDLKNVKGISSSNAEKIYDRFHGEEK